MKEFILPSTYNLSIYSKNKTEKKEMESKNIEKANFFKISTLNRQYNGLTKGSTTCLLELNEFKHDGEDKLNKRLLLSNTLASLASILSLPICILSTLISSSSSYIRLWLDIGKLFSKPFRPSVQIAGSLDRRYGPYFGQVLSVEVLLLVLFGIALALCRVRPGQHGKTLGQRSGPELDFFWKIFFQLFAQRRTQSDVEHKVKAKVAHFQQSDYVEQHGRSGIQVDAFQVVIHVLEYVSVVDQIGSYCEWQLGEKNAERENN
ncbi:hypothetical protein BpHYR1_014479 [Brachionus plicatilis]|uniref:Uncharacterized protein n=1 Tax=Brachionus plicatilis TaxID=10195 RepID=A0A3M7R9T9_BRAPC|nr:hypothetical protein BpHYR1_014479 [Brachionus plicatilis]